MEQPIRLYSSVTRLTNDMGCSVCNMKTQT